MGDRRKNEVRCSCGHVGFIVKNENDSPYSMQWESYKLENLNGNAGFQVEGDSIDFTEAFARLNPSCPRCNKPIVR